MGIRCKLCKKKKTHASHYFLGLLPLLSSGGHKWQVYVFFLDSSFFDHFLVCFSWLTRPTMTSVYWDVKLNLRQADDKVPTTTSISVLFHHCYLYMNCMLHNTTDMTLWNNTVRKVEHLVSQCSALVNFTTCLYLAHSCCHVDCRFLDEFLHLVFCFFLVPSSQFFWATQF